MGERHKKFEWSDIVINYLHQNFVNPLLYEILVEYEDVKKYVKIGEQSISQRELLRTLRIINYISGYTYEFRFGKTSGLWIRRVGAAEESQ